MQLQSTIAVLICFGSGLAQEAPVRNPNSDGMLRLKPSTENRLPARPEKKPDTSTTSTKVKPAAGGNLTLTSLDAGSPVELKSPEASAIPFPPNKAGLLFEGYDPVELFANRNLTVGKPAVSVPFAAGSINFASEKNRLKFTEAPEAFLPEFGGYCAYNMAQGQALPATPKSYRILAGRLYLFESEAFALTWDKDPELQLLRARDAWSRLAKR